MTIGANIKSVAPPNAICTKINIVITFDHHKTDLFPLRSLASQPVRNTRKTLVKIAVTGCRSRNRRRMCEVSEKSFAIPSERLPDGKIMLDKAAIEPLMLTMNIATTPIKIPARYFGSARNLKIDPTLADRAVSVKNASKIKVLMRWAAIQNGRADVNVSAVFPVNTSPAPIAPSVSTKKKDAAANLSVDRDEASRRLYHIQNAQPRRISIRSPSNALMMRCVNSITVLN